MIPSHIPAYSGSSGLNDQDWAVRPVTQPGPNFPPEVRSLPGSRYATPILASMGTPAPTAASDINISSQATGRGTDIPPDFINNVPFDIIKEITRQFALSGWNKESVSTLLRLGIVSKQFQKLVNEIIDHNQKLRALVNKESSSAAMVRADLIADKNWTGCFAKAISRIYDPIRVFAPVVTIIPVTFWGLLKKDEYLGRKSFNSWILDPTNPTLDLMCVIIASGLVTIGMQYVLKARTCLSIYYSGLIKPNISKPEVKLYLSKLNSTYLESIFIAASEGSGTLLIDAARCGKLSTEKVISYLQELGRVLRIRESLRRIQIQVKDDNLDKWSLRPYLATIKKDLEVTYLDFGNNTLGDAGAIMVADALDELPKLAELNLSNNGIGETGAVSLAQALLTSQSLKKLNLSSNPIGSIGASALADALKENATLLKLRLGASAIDEATAIMLVASLKAKKIKFDLHLRGPLDGAASAIFDKAELPKSVRIHY